MDYAEAKRVNTDLELVGIRASATAVGLLRLITELRASENLNDAAVMRIRDAIIDDLNVARSCHETEADFRSRLQTRLDCLMGISGAK